MTSQRNKVPNAKTNVRTNVIANVGGGNLILPKFHAFYKPSGVANLDPRTVINSTAVLPDLRYKFGDADGTDLDPWTYGETLSIVAGTVPTYNQGSNGLGVSDDSVKFNAGGYYQAGNNTFGNVETKDFRIEGVAEATGTTCVLFAKRNAGIGYEIGIDASDRLYLTIEDAGGATTTVSAALTVNCIHRFAINADRSGSCQIYVSGSASGAAVDISSRSGTLDSATAFTIGADSAGNNPYDKRVMYLAMWSGASWLDSHLQASLETERQARWQGTWPYRASGTKAPVTSTRAFPAYLDKIESGYRKYYYVGGEHLRMCHRQDSNGVNVRGYLSETQATNLFPWSEEYLGKWNLLDAGDTLVNNVMACPDGRIVAGSIAGDSTDGQHGMTIGRVTTAVTHTLSGHFYPGNLDWVRLQDSSLANVYCDFDIANGIKGTAAANCVGYIEGPFYGGFYRVCIVYTANAGAATIRIQPIPSDGDPTYSGDGTPDLYVWNVQLEAGDYMTSAIRTSGAAATRLKDQLQFVAGDNIGGEDRKQGTFVADVLLPNYDVSIAKTVMSISDGGAAADSIVGQVATDDTWTCDTRATAGNDGDVTIAGDIADGVKHEVRLTWEANKVTAYRDGVAGTPDITAGMPDAVDEIDIGQSVSSAAQFNGPIQNFRIYDVPTEEGDV